MEPQEFFDHCQAMINANETVQYEGEAQLIEYMSKRHPEAWATARELMVEDDPSLEEFGSFTASIGEAIDHGFDEIDQQQFLRDLEDVINGLLDGRPMANGDFID